MAKSADAFRSIGEVARLIGVAPHVLRYWEGQFPQLSPVKRADGRRYYRPDDVRLAAGLCMVMRDEGMTARGAARLMADDKGAALRARGAARLAELLNAPAAPDAAVARKSTRNARRPVDRPPGGDSAPSDRADLPLFPASSANGSAGLPSPPSPAITLPLAPRLAQAGAALARLPDPSRHTAVLLSAAEVLRSRLAASG